MNPIPNPDANPNQAPQMSLVETKRQSCACVAVFCNKKKFPRAAPLVAVCLPEGTAGSRRHKCS